MSQAAQIVALLIEADPYFPAERKRRVRYDYIIQLKDKAGLDFKEIGKELGMTASGAYKLYRVGKARQGAPNDPFAHLTFRTRNILNNLGHALRWPHGWSTMPDALERLASVPEETLMGMEGAGKFVVSEIQRLLTERGLAEQEPVAAPLPVR